MTSISLLPADREDFAELRRLNTALFQSEYSKTYYKDVLESGQLSKLAYVDGELAGGVCCRVQQNDSDRNLEAIVVTMGVLQAFRHQGIASRLLRHVISHTSSDARIGRVRLAVHVKNLPAICLYEKLGLEKLCVTKSEEWVMVLDVEEA